MSIWTHVAGIIRIDDIYGSGINIDPWIGNGAFFRDDKSVWAACDRPLGSEGSLNASIYTSPDVIDVARYVVTIWGDLRDYEDANEIIEYFSKITKDRMVRQGIADIECEFPIHIICDSSGTWTRRL